MYLVRAASRSNDLLIQNTIDVLLNAAVIEAFACAMESNGKIAGRYCLVDQVQLFLFQIKHFFLLLKSYPWLWGYTGFAAISTTANDH